MKDSVTRRMAVSGLVGAAAIGPNAVQAQAQAQGSVAGGFRQNGEKAGARAVEDKAREILSLGDFAEPQEALDQAFRERAAIMAPRGTYKTTGLRVAGYALTGLGARFQRAGGSRPVITIPSNPNGLQTTDAVVVRDIEIDSALAGKRTGIGLMVENSAIAEIGSVRVRGAAIGVMMDRCQFAPAYHLKCYDNDVGIVLRPGLEAGGANSITFTHPVLANNKVGMIIDNSGNRYGQGDIVLVNPQMLVSFICALAVIGLSRDARTSAVTILGSGPEANAPRNFAESSYTYNGTVIPRSSYFLRFAVVHMIGVSIAEYAEVDPCIILQSATLTMTDCAGYGNPSGRAVRADAESSVIILGHYGVIGVCHGVTHFSGHLSTVAPAGAIVGPRRETLSHTIPNAFASPDVANFGSAIGAASQKYGFDARGRYVEVAFAAVAGTADGHCIRLDAKGLQGDRVVYRVELMSATDTRIRLSFYPNEVPVVIDLIAGQPTLVVVFGNAVANASGLIVIAPVGRDGPKVRVRSGHAVAGSRSDPLFRAQCDAICAGAFNPNVPGAIPFPAQAAAPTSGAYPVGARVPNAAPARGLPLEWVHAGGGQWIAIPLP